MNSLAVIIPTLNEECHLPELLLRLNAMRHVSEIVVSDGGSVDSTVSIAQNYGVKVVLAKGRGAQMNAGVHVTSSRVLWFLHADTKPPPNSATAILRAVSNPRVYGGNFRLKFDLSTPSARFFENIARVQRHFGIYYGDSGIWLRREVFDDLGGFCEWPLFEDYDLVRRLEDYSGCHAGRTLRLWPALVASSRRFEQRPWSTLAKWLSLQTLFFLGVAPEKLARLYRN